MKTLEEKRAYMHAYYVANRDARKANRLANKEVFREKRKTYYLANKEKIAARKKAKYDANPEKERAAMKRRRDTNRGRYNELNRARYLKNHKKTMARLRGWSKVKYDNDPNFKMLKILRVRTHKALKRNSKAGSSRQLLGCTIVELREHLENQFLPGMVWENYGKRGWHIDHKRPCASFDLTQPEQQKACFHYTNLQPLWAKDNHSKGAKII